MTALRSWSTTARLQGGLGDSMRYNLARVRGSGNQRERWCPLCCEWLPVGCFRRDKRSAGGYRNQCRACKSLREAASGILRLVFRDVQ